MRTDGWMFYHSGHECLLQRGVGFLVAPKFVKSILKVEPVSDRLIAMRLDAKPRPITIVPVYMPTTDSDDDEV